MLLWSGMKHSIAAVTMHCVNSPLFSLMLTVGATPFKDVSNLSVEVVDN